MRQYKVTVDGVVFNVAVEPCEGGFKTSFSAPLKAESKAEAAPLSDGSTAEAKAATFENKAASSDGKAAFEAGSGEVTAPMPGNILDIKVKEGDSVKAGDVIMILEAMKMEIEVTATATGKITSINVQKGAMVNTGDTVAVIG